MARQPQPPRASIDAQLAALDALPAERAGKIDALQRALKGGHYRIAAKAARLAEDALLYELVPKMLDAYALPPQSPEDCIFAKTTACVSANFEKPITPCQFGGNPDCENCGCIASAALAAVGRHSLPGGLTLGKIFDASFEIGNRVKAVRETFATR